MANENKTRSGWWILLYLSPLYLLLAYPLYKWHKKITSPDVSLTSEEYRAFASDEGELKKSSVLDSYTPNLHDLSYTVRYKTEGETADYKDENRKKTVRTDSRRSTSADLKRARKKSSGNRKSASYLSVKMREYMSIGSQKGYMTSLLGKVMNNPKVMKALFNNSLVVKGFMQRGTVKKALSSPEQLTNYITKTNAVNNFLSNPVVQKALNSPAVVNTIASSKLMSEIINSPAISGLVKDPSKINQIISENPELGKLLSNPNIMNALMNNPATAGAMTNINIGGMKFR